MKIIYKQKDGRLAMVFPAKNIGLSLLEIAKKETPFGVPFLIVDDSAVPNDWSQSDSWEADFSSPDGVGIGSHRYFMAQAEAVISNENSTPEQIGAALLLKEQMQREITQLEGV